MRCHPGIPTMRAFNHPPCRGLKNEVGRGWRDQIVQSHLGQCRGRKTQASLLTSAPPLTVPIPPRCVED